MDISIPKDFRKHKIPKNAVRSMVAETVGYYIDKWNLKEIWKHNQGEGVRIAVLDTGAATHHDALVHEMFNFTDDPDEIDMNGHGSHVTGIINAQHNIIGIQGIAPRAYIVSCKVLNKSGRGSSTWIKAALKMIIRRGDIHIVNMSLGSSQIDTETKSLLTALYRKGVAIFVAAGNWGKDASNGYAIPETFAVAAVDRHDQPADFSSEAVENDGSGYGVDIFSFGVGQEVWSANGTSMACPSVAGVAALIQSAAVAKGQPLRPEALFDILRTTAKDIHTPNHDAKTGYGLIQPLAAFREVVPIPIKEEPEPEIPTDDLPKKWVMWVVFAFIILVLFISFYLGKN